MGFLSSLRFARNDNSNRERNGVFGLKPENAISFPTSEHVIPNVVRNPFHQFHLCCSLRKMFAIYCLLFTGSCTYSLAQEKISREEYIEKYKSDAVKDMLKMGVPASITLAQALLESDNGNSPLSTSANNHFGIKCHDWKGPRYYHDDDKKHECFRKYDDVLDSYDDHSSFLRTRDRYAFLFNIPRTDYKSWAFGLKKAGYATAPDYAERLIKIIEDNKLYELDKMGKIPPIDHRATTMTSKSNPKIANVSVIDKRVLLNNDVKYVIVQKGDSYLKIAKENEMKLWQILKYNEITESAPIVEGQKVYLQPKRRKAKEEFHIVQQGETMYFISQLYGIKLKHLYKKNLMNEGEESKAGQKLWMREKKKEK